MVKKKKKAAKATKTAKKGKDVPPPILPASTNSPASKKQLSPHNKNLTQTSSAPTSPSRNTRSNTNPEDLLTPKQPPKIPTTDTGDDDAHEMTMHVKRIMQLQLTSTKMG